MTTDTPPEARVRELLLESARVKREVAEQLSADIAAAAEVVIGAFRAGGKVLLFGNGGSAGDAQHIAAEWTGKLGPDRPALPALALGVNNCELSAVGNDYGFERVFARGVEALGRAGDVAIALSTSGESPNVLAAATRARELGLRTIALLGKGGGRLARQVELPLVVASDRTPHVQEAHIAIGHAIAALVDEALFPELYDS